jgi:MFS family permease
LSAYEPVQESPRRIPRLWPFKNIYYGWAVVSAATIASFGMVPMFGPVLGIFFAPIQEELGWDRATISLAFTIGSASSSVIALLIGRLLDRYGARMVVVSAGIVIALAMVGISAMQEPWQFWVLFGAGRGSALAGIQTGTGVALSNWFIRKRGRALAIRGMGLRAGQSLMPIIIFAIMAASDWRTAFLALAGFTFLSIVLPSWLFIRRRPEDLGLHPDGASKAFEQDTAPSGRSRFARHAHDISWTLAEARRTRAFWILLFFIAVERFALGSINLHMVVSFEDRGLPAALAVSVLSIFAATSAITTIPWGLVFERLHVRIGGMLMCALMLIAIGLLLVADNYLLAVAFALTFGLAVGASSLLHNLLWAEYFGRKHQGAIHAFGAPFRLIGPVGPVLTGYLYDVTGSYTLPFSIFFGVFVLMFIGMMFAAPPTKPPLTPADEPIV